MPTSLEGVDELALLLRRHTTEDVVSRGRGLDLCRSVELGGVYLGVCARNAHDAGDRGDGSRVVAGDDVEGNALVAEIANGLPGA